ncbi:DNA methyltransferase [uncultured archaeon]|nr:DNA methyltransferase [uncultured archaeon]
MRRSSSGDSTDVGNLVSFTSAEGLINRLRHLLGLEGLEDVRTEASEIRRTLENTNPGSSFFTELQRKGIMSELDQILEAREMERAEYYINRLVRGLIEEKPGRVNDINLNRWKEYEDVYTDSLWYLDKRDSTGAHNAGYWGNFIPQIPYQLLKRFTRKGDCVLDLFVGSGTTLIECRRQGRNGVGFDLSREALDLARENLSKEEDRYGTRVEAVRADSTSADYSSELGKLGIESVQLVLMHPPYWDIIKFSGDEEDLSNASSLDVFLNGISACAEKAHSVLEDRRHLALIIGDKYSKGEWVPLGFRSMEKVLEAGFRLKSIIVKNFDQTKGKQSQKELWRYRALAGGFYVFKHEYIFLFEKA